MPDTALPEGLTRTYPDQRSYHITTAQAHYNLYENCNGDQPTPWCSGKLGLVHENLCVCVWSIVYDESKYVDQE